MSTSNQGTADAEQARALFQLILSVVQQPGGYARLTVGQRRILMAAVLGAVVPCDGKTLPIELKHLTRHLSTHFRLTSAEQKLVMQIVHGGVAPDQLSLAMAQLKELLGLEDKASLIQMMWDIAFCDHELHPAEEKLVYQVADAAGLMRKRVVEEQAKAARLNGF